MDPFITLQALILVICCVQKVSSEDSSGNPLDVTAASYSITAIELHPTELKCDYMITNLAKHIIVKWLKRKEGEDVNVWKLEYLVDEDKRTSSPGTGYEGRLREGYITSDDLFYRHILEFISVNQTDTGAYCCEVKYMLSLKANAEVFEGKSGDIMLTVHVSPLPALQLYTHDGRVSPEEVKERESLTFQCTSPPAIPNEMTFFIRKNTVNFPCPKVVDSSSPESNMCRLNITMSRHDNDAGTTWWCNAVWQKVYYNSPIKIIKILFHATWANITEPLPKAVMPLKRVTMTCETGSANPPAVVLWRKNWKIITQNSEYTNGKTRITSSLLAGKYDAFRVSSKLSLIATPESQGLYDCMIKYCNITAVKTTLALRGPIATINGYPGEMIKGTNLSLICLSDQSSIVQEESFEWSYSAPDKAPRVMARTARFTLLHVDIADSGDYICTVSNAYGTGTASVDVSVVPPTVAAYAQATADGTVGMASGIALAMIGGVIIIAVILLLLHRRSQGDLQELANEATPSPAPNQDADGPTVPKPEAQSLEQPDNHSADEHETVSVDIIDPVAKRASGTSGQKQDSFPSDPVENQEADTSEKPEAPLVDTTSM